MVELILIQLPKHVLLYWLGLLLVRKSATAGGMSRSSGWSLGAQLLLRTREGFPDIRLNEDLGNKWGVGIVHLLSELKLGSDDVLAMEHPECY